MVDDNPIDVTIARRVYERSELPNPFITFSGGAEFLEYLELVKTGEAETPAIVLLDINMPVMNGFETVQNIRKQNEFSHIPVIIMFTNSDDPADMERAIELGANGFQTKYFEIEKYTEFFNSLKA
tara:strand:- start:2940 stop:3314 length:375 start_codon:yes stop_codon:yes gene_type:complete